MGSPVEIKGGQKFEYKPRERQIAQVDFGYIVDFGTRRGFPVRDYYIVAQNGTVSKLSESPSRSSQSAIKSPKAEARPRIIGEKGRLVKDRGRADGYSLRFTMHDQPGPFGITQKK